MSKSHKRVPGDESNPAKSDDTSSRSPESVIDEASEAIQQLILRQRLLSRASKTEDVKPQLWRFEIRDPRKSTKWKTLCEIDEDELSKAEAIRDEENRTNAPALIRIVRKTRF